MAPLAPPLDPQLVRPHSIFYFYILKIFTVALKGQGNALTDYSYTMIICGKSSFIKNVSNWQYRWYF